MHEALYDPDDPDAFPQDEDPTDTDSWRPPLYTPDGPMARDTKGDYVRFLDDGSVSTMTQDGFSVTDPADQAVTWATNPSMGPIDASPEDPYSE
jgi:hypothetical protein